jgi:YbbR domain-containing protein
MQPIKDKFLEVWFTKKSNLKTRSSILFFLLCVAFSFFLWLLIKLTDNYKTIIHFPVKFINLPENKIYTNILPAHISVEIEAKGYSLLQQRFNSKNDTIFIDYNKEQGLFPNSNHVYFISLANRKDELRNQLKDVGTIYSISPDTVYFNFTEKEVKKLKVKLNATINFKKQFQLKDSIQLSPAYIEIYGPLEHIKDLNEIETEEIILYDVSEDKEFELNLKIPATIPTYYLFSHKTVKVKIPVDRFTETNIVLNIQPINIPDSFDVVLIPNKAEVILLVPFSKYKIVNQHEWKMQVDFKNYKNKNRLPLSLISYPNFVRIQEIKPAEIEYILIKKDKK